MHLKHIHDNVALYYRPNYTHLKYCLVYQLISLLGCDTFPGSFWLYDVRCPTHRSGATNLCRALRPLDNTPPTVLLDERTRLSLVFLNNRKFTVLSQHLLKTQPNDIT